MAHIGDGSFRVTDGSFRIADGLFQVVEGSFPVVDGVEGSFYQQHKPMAHIVDVSFRGRSQKGY